MTDPRRIQTFDEFWPYYLSEHRDPTSRHLHFVGTTGFFASVVGSALLNPVRFPAALAGFGALLRHGSKKAEPKGPAFKHVAAMLGVGIAGSPVLFPAGVGFAYGCAWVGHFVIEKNRPATFEYPLWSLASDFRMWSHMARGRLWKGDPLEELGLEQPIPNAPADHPVPTVLA